jgi:hypothetical protein
VTLPTYDRAVQLLDFYTFNVSWTYHFLHLPTLRRHLQTTYFQLSENQSPDPTVLALICCVFAVAKYFVNPATCASHEEDVSGTGERNPCEFITLASQMLAEARHLDHPTLESIQAVLLLASHLLMNLGHMTSFRSLLTTMFMSAQAIGIHQVDSQKNQRLRQSTNYDHVELELKRRIWWHIVSSDW